MIPSIGAQNHAEAAADPQRASRFGRGAGAMLVPADRGASVKRLVAQLIARIRRWWRRNVIDDEDDLWPDGGER